MGTPWAMLLAVRRSCGAVGGDQTTLFGFSDTWQLAMNTRARRLITFLIVFKTIQASQNRDGAGRHS